MHIKIRNEKAAAVLIIKLLSRMISVLVPYLGQPHQSLSQPNIVASSIENQDKHKNRMGQTVSRHQPQ